MQSAPDVAVIVVTHNSESVIDGLLESVPAACGALSAMTVVVDNGSTDATADRVAARADCTLVRSSNVGYAAGINLGVRRVPSQVSRILVLNPDVRLQPDSVVQLAEALTDGVGVTVPRIVDERGVLQLSLRRQQSLLRACGLTFTKLPALSEYVAERAAYDRPHDVDWATGAVMLIDRGCHDALGGWDESFFLYSEETDFSLRARDAGWSTRYEPTATAVHIGGGSGRSSRTHVMQIVNRVRLYRRRHGTVAAWLYYLLTVIGEASNMPAGAEHRAAVVALLRPRQRPGELNCPLKLLPS